MSITELQKLSNGLAQGLFGMLPEEVQRKGICIDCKSPIRYEVGADESGESGQIYSDAGVREYQMLGIRESH